MQQPFVQLVKVTGCFSLAQLTRCVLARYPQARIQPAGHEPYTAFIAIPNLTWSLAPGGDKDFFCGLSRAGVIGNYAHRVYSDWNEGALR